MATAKYDPAAQFKLIDEASKQHLAAIERQKNAELKKINSAYTAELAKIKNSGKAKAEQEKEIAKITAKYQKEIATKEAAYDKAASERKKASLKILQQYEANLLKTGDAEQRAAVRKAQIERLENLQEEFKTRLDNEQAYAAEADRLAKLMQQEKDAARKAELKNELDAIKIKSDAEKAWIKENQEAYNSSSSDITNTKIEQAKDLAASGDPEAMKAAAKDLREAAKSQDATSEESMRATQAAINLENAAREEEAKEKNKAIKAELKYRLTTLDGIKDTLEDGLLKATAGLSKMFDSLEGPINSFYEYQAKYEARMQGSNNSYGSMMTNVGFTIGMSPFLKQTKMVENLQRLIDTGTNYNLELRAYIATVSEGIATTFEAFDSNLLRLVRIQQSDSTAARLGMEAALTKMLNKMYSDSSYLTDVSDNVTAALLDASAQLTHQGAAEMEFVAQKWLGSLYSLGVSSDTVQSIATGLGYLGSGNIEGLTGNESLMNLLTMGAAKSGKSITEIMTGGLTAEKTNELLKGITTYLAEIATNTDSNNVVKSSIAQVFGVSNTDLRSISNLTQSDIDYLYADSTLNYSQALAEASSQLKQISSRTHISAMINNLMDNAQTSSALMIGGNPVTYSLYKALNVVSGLVGDRGLEIPGIQAMGTGTASGIDVLSIAKAAIAGGGLLASLIGSIGSLGSGGLPALSRWEGYEQSLERGSGFELNYEGIDSGFSENVVYSNNSSGSTSDVTAASMQDATDAGKENQSEDDKAVADDAAKYYREGLERLNDMVNFINQLKIDTDLGALHVTVQNTTSAALPVTVVGSVDLPTKLKEVDAATQLILARLIKAGMFGELSSKDGKLTLDGNNDSLDVFDLMKSGLSGLEVRVNNDTTDAIPVTRGIGGIL